MFVFLLCMTVATTGIVLVLNNPTKMKATISQSGFYGSLVSGILAQSQQQTDSLNDPIDTIPLDRPEIKAAIESAFSPEVLQQQGETMVDGIYAWLQGKSDVPNFRINLAKSKAAFALAVGDYVQKRLSSLPACTVATDPSTLDAFNTTCLPGGLDVPSEVDKVELEVAASSQFLPNPVITADTFTGSSGQPLFKQLHQLPGYFQTAQTFPFIFGTLTLFASGVEIITGADKRRAIQRLGTIYASVGLFFIITAWLFNSLFQHFTSSLDAQASSSFFTQKFSQIFNQADKAINREYVILGIACIVLGGVVYFIAKILPIQFDPSANEV